MPDGECFKFLNLLVFCIALKHFTGKPAVITQAKNVEVSCRCSDVPSNQSFENPSHLSWNQPEIPWKSQVQPVQRSFSSGIPRDFSGPSWGPWHSELDFTDPFFGSSQQMISRAMARMELNILAGILFKSSCFILVYIYIFIFRYRYT